MYRCYHYIPHISVSVLCSHLLILLPHMHFSDNLLSQHAFSVVEPIFVSSLSSHQFTNHEYQSTSTSPPYFNILAVTPSSTVLSYFRQVISFSTYSLPIPLSIAIHSLPASIPTFHNIDLPIIFLFIKWLKVLFFPHISFLLLRGYKNSHLLFLYSHSHATDPYHFYHPHINSTPILTPYKCTSSKHFTNM